MEKVYCKMCRYCDDSSSLSSLYRCLHPKNKKDTFYGRSYANVYCHDKNYDNHCPDFTLLEKLARKQKRREWFNSLVNKIKDFKLKSLSKVISRLGLQ